MIKMALKSVLFYRKITNIAQRLGAPLSGPSQSHYLFRDYAPFVTRLSCISLFSTGPKSDNFWAKKTTTNFWFNPFSKILVACLVAITGVDKFFSWL